MPKNSTIHYALKANNNPQILKILQSEKFGLDVVSGGELDLGLRSGFDPHRIVFSGVGKSTAEIEAALNAGILQLNVESVPELERIAQVAKRLDKVASVALRVNPDVDAATHPYIRTGFRENKFGIDLADISLALDLVKKSNGLLKLEGLTLHIGSQIQDVAPFEAAFKKSISVMRSLQEDGMALRSLDLGGGLGIDYHNRDESQDEKRIFAYGNVLKSIVKEIPDVQLRLEPGRILVARAGVLIAQVEYVKRTPHKNFVILNTGMHHLLRPALYQAHHHILPLKEQAGREDTYDVVGPICESADTLGFERRLPELSSGDLVAIMDVGAYGAVMMSDYNMHGRAKEVFVT